MARTPPRGPPRDLAVALSRASPETWTDLQGVVDDLIRAYAEEADVSPRRLRLVVGMLLGELRLLDVGLDEAQALVVRMRPRLR